jgi:tellurite methyltransferase
MKTLQEQFGNIDIYLFDQLLKGRVAPGMRIVDAGCGGGRNLIYLLREGYEVYGADMDEQSIERLQSFAKKFAPALPSSNFRAERVEQMSFEDGFADVVISNAVLHLASDDTQFEAMLQGSWRVLRPGGLLFCRVATTIGMEDRFVHIQGRRFRSPDGAERYLLDEKLLNAITERLNGELIEPLKTTVVQNQRAMTTWVLRKRFP